MTAAVEDGTVRRDLIVEDRLLRNVVGALRRALNEHPDGCLEAALWHGVEACFVPRVIFNEAVDIMVYAGLAVRAGGRLNAGLNRTDPACAGRRNPLFRTLPLSAGGVTECSRPSADVRTAQKARRTHRDRELRQ